MTRLILLAFLIVFTFPALSLAKGSVDVGDTLPHDLSAKDQTGKMRSFDDLKGSKGMTLVFVRSADWCPHCKKQLIELGENAGKFSKEGYPVVTLSYDAVEKLNKYLSNHKADMTMLSDPASEIIRAFGILNEKNAKGTFSYGIPHPGVYIVGKDKKVQAKFFKADYKERASVKELLAEIKKLNPPEVPPESMDEDPIVPGEDTISTPEKIIDSVTLPDEAAVTPKLPESAVTPDAAISPEVAAPDAALPEIKALESAPSPELVVPDAPEAVVAPDISMPDVPLVEPDASGLQSPVSPTSPSAF